MISIATTKPTPYRLRLFEKIKVGEKINCIFMDDIPDKRHWSVDNSTYSIEITTGRGYKIAGCYVPVKSISPLITSRLRVVADNGQETLLYILLCMLLSSVGAGEYVLWTQAIDTEWSNSGEKSLLQYLYRMYIRMAYRLSTGIIAIGGMAARYAERRGADPKKIHTAWNTLADKNEYTDIKSTPSTVFLFVGYMSERKGLDTLLAAYNKAELKNTQLWIAGKGKMSRMATEYANKRQDIKFLGFLDGEDKWNTYRRADVIVIPSLHDSWGLVANEAIKTGNALIVSKAAGASEHLIDGNGLRVEPGDTQGLMRAMEHMSLSENTVEKYKERSRRLSGKVFPFKSADVIGAALQQQIT